MRRTLITLLFAGVAAFSFGCAARPHLTATHGERSRTYFETQRASAKAPSESPTELDSEEAAIIHGEYRKNLGAAATPAPNGARVLVLEPDK